MIQILIDKGANVNAKLSDLDTPLHLACEIQTGSRKAVETLMDKGADANLRGHGDDTPLHRTIIKGNTEAALALIKKGANIHKINNNFSPLNMAINHEHHDIAIALINKGADVNAKSVHDMAPLHILAHQPFHEKLILKLIEKGADVNGENAELLTPLHLAASEGNCKMAEILIDKGSDINRFVH